MTEALRLHVVSHSHWDREWYSPLQVSRIPLVKMVDTFRVPVGPRGVVTVRVDV